MSRRKEKESAPEAGKRDEKRPKTRRVDDKSFNRENRQKALSERTEKEHKLLGTGYKASQLPQSRRKARQQPDTRQRVIQRHQYDQIEQKTVSSALGDGADAPTNWGADKKRRNNRTEKKSATIIKHIISALIPTRQNNSTPGAKPRRVDLEGPASPRAEKEMLFNTLNWSRSSLTPEEWTKNVPEPRKCMKSANTLGKWGKKKENEPPWKFSL